MSEINEEQNSERVNVRVARISGALCIAFRPCFRD